MTKMLKLASLSGVALGILSTVAVAADLPSRRAPAPFVAPPPVFTWTGFYVGLNAGAIWNANNPNNQVFTLFPQNNNNNNRLGFIGGGQIGYNYQVGSFVAGIEADFQGRSNIGRANNIAFFNNGNNNRGGFLGTVRGRIGFTVTPQFLIYGTGGFAYGDSFDNNVVFGVDPATAAVLGIAPFVVANNNNNSFRVGGTIGGGIEYALSPNWSVKAEYLYVALRRQNNNNPAFIVGGQVFNNNFNNRNQAHIARLGVNYRFNFGAAPVAPVVARY